MGNNGQTGQQAFKRAILHDVYRSNLSAEKLLSLQQRGQRRQRMGRWVRVAGLVVILPLMGSGAHSVFPGGADSLPPGKSAAVEIAAAGWNSGLPPLIDDANAGVTSSQEMPVSTPMAPHRRAFLSGRGAVAPLDGSDGPDEWTVPDGGISSASDYRVLLDRPAVALADLFGLEVRTIVIDPGHGGEDPGAIGPSGMLEKDITLEIARLLYERLVRREGLRVFMTRDSDVTLSLKHRVEFARENSSDLLISIHLNTIPNDPMTIVETYYFGPPADEHSLKAAEQENRRSDYMVAEFGELIAGLSDTLKQQESRRLAAHIQRNVYRTLHRSNRNIVNVGIKTAPFVVLLGAETTSVLAEVTCISNTEEEARLAKPAYRDKIAGALERGILSYLKQSGRQQGRPPRQWSTTYGKS